MIRVPLPLENCTLAEIEAFVAQCRSDAAGFDEFGEKYRLAMDTWQGTMTTRVLRGEPPYTIAELAAIVLGPVVFVAVNARRSSPASASLWVRTRGGRRTRSAAWGR